MASKNIPVNGWPQLKDLEAVQPILNRLDKIEAWKRTVKEETFTGDDITIENALALPARSLITEINAIQDLHGYDKPWVGGAGKNKLNVTATTQTKNGYTFTFANDGTFSISGTPTSTVTEVTLATQTIPSGDYKLNGCGFANDNCRLQLFKGSTLVGSQYNNNDLSFTSDGGEYKLTIVVINAAGTLNNQIVKPMIRLATESDASFAPYTNFCPISGRTEARVVDDGANKFDKTTVIDKTYINLADGALVTESYTGWVTSQPIAITGGSIKFSGNNNASANTVRYRTLNSGGTVLRYGGFPANTESGTLTAETGEVNIQFCIRTDSIDTFSVITESTTATIQLGTTVYGGEVDFNEGKAKVTDAYIASYDGETLPSTWISDRDVYAEGTTPTTGAEVVYKLTTPTTIQLTPTQLEMLKGYNRVTLSDGYGTIELKALTGANWS